MRDAAYVYYLSPFDYLLSCILAVIALFVFLTLFQRKRLYDKSPATLVIAVVGGLTFFIICLLLLLSRAVNPQRQLVIDRDYTTCRSWSHRQRVPWRYVAGISLAQAGRYGENIVLRFELAAAYIDQVNWTDWVKSNGWVNCQVSGVTDNPRRLALPFDTHEIYNQVVEAWRAGRWR